MSENDTDQKTDGEKLIDGLNEMIEDSTPDEEDWCPNCEKYAVFDVIQTVERPEFGVENDVKACPDCRYTAINQTEWRSLETETDRAEADYHD